MKKVDKLRLRGRGKGTRVLTQADVEAGYQRQQLWFKRCMCGVYLLAGMRPPKEYTAHKQWVLNTAKRYGKTIYRPEIDEIHIPRKKQPDFPASSTFPIPRTRGKP